MNTSKTGAQFGVALMVADLLLALSGVGVLGYQCVLCLQDGYWTPMSFSPAGHWLGGGEPAFRWQGVQRIALWVLGCPLSGVIIAAGILVD